MNPLDTLIFIIYYVNFEIYYIINLNFIFVIIVLHQKITKKEIFLLHF